MDKGTNRFKSIFIDAQEKTRLAEVLLEAKVVGKFICWNKKSFHKRIMAMLTRFHWTSMDKSTVHDNDSNLATMITCILVSGVTIKSMWSLNIIGTTDRPTKKSYEEKNLKVKDKFLNTIAINHEGRYEVVLSGRMNHSLLMKSRLSRDLNQHQRIIK